ncbi:hypothetical protein [Rahnella sikkimica]|nr:hypothetical protein [Rahnella sikkimica]
MKIIYYAIEIYGLTCGKHAGITHEHYGFIGKKRSRGREATLSKEPATG